VQALKHLIASKQLVSLRHVLAAASHSPFLLVEHSATGNPASAANVSAHSMNEIS